MLFTDEDLYGPQARQLDIDEVIEQVDRDQAAAAYPVEAGVWDLWGAGQYALSA